MALDSVKDILKVIKYRNKKPNEQFFVMECSEKESVCFILEQKVLEIMLSDAWGLKELYNCCYLDRVGWHEGNDRKVYIRYVLSERGNDLYNVLEIKEKGKNYIKALNEMNNGTNSKHLLYEKEDIRLYNYTFKVNKIYKYEGKELGTQNSQDEGLSR